MPYLAVVKVENKRIAKYQYFELQSDADAHVVTYGGFAVETPSSGTMNYWLVDEGAKTVTHDSVTETADNDAFTALDYSRKRKTAYDKLNQFELISDGGTIHKDAIAVIKKKYPKPE
tara:strand:- start:289 stop:639 length:351 start_codon:yes stop_codon:yes gene_type:complete